MTTTILKYGIVDKLRYYELDKYNSIILRHDPIRYFAIIEFTNFIDYGIYDESSIYSFNLEFTEPNVIGIENRMVND